MPDHKFRVGQQVTLAANFTNRHDMARRYMVTKRLPSRDGEVEYRIKRPSELYERVARESDLKPNGADADQGIHHSHPIASIENERVQLELSTGPPIKRPDVMLKSRRSSDLEYAANSSGETSISSQIVGFAEVVLISRMSP